jgi:acetoin utilization deacetylase AcuC-like enzyme
MMQITPFGYAHMTHMLNALSGGKMLVILEGGFVANTFLNCSVFY